MAILPYIYIFHFQYCQYCNTACYIIGMLLCMRVLEMRWCCQSKARFEVVGRLTTELVSMSPWVIIYWDSMLLVCEYVCILCAMSLQPCLASGIDTGVQVCTQQMGYCNHHHCILVRYTYNTGRYRYCNIEILQYLCTRTRVYVPRVLYLLYCNSMGHTGIENRRLDCIAE